MGMLLHRQGEARRKNPAPKPPVNTGGSGSSEQTGESGGKKPPSPSRPPKK